MPVDPGSTFTTALNLGNLSGSTNTSFSNFVGGSDLDDYLRFSLSSSSSITLTLSGLQGDADLSLLNSAGQLLGESFNPSTESETITANNLAAGVYYIRVNAFGGAITNYTMGFQGSGGASPEAGNSLASALDLGGFNYVLHTRSNTVNGASDPVDLYRFELNASSDINLALGNLNGDADVSILNSLGAIIATSDQSGTAAEAIATTLASGTYYVQVSAFDSGTINYTLNLGISLDDAAGNTLATARKINNVTTTLAGRSVFNDFLSGAGVNGADTNDFYRFSVLTSTDYTITVDGLSTDIDLAIIQDRNNNGVIDSGELIASSLLPGTTTETLSGVLDAGTYFVRVYPFSSAAGAYTLTIDASPQDGAGNALATARNLGSLVGDRTYNDFVGTPDTNDYYRFTLANTSDFSLALSQLQADADVQLLSSTGAIITESLNSGSNSETINTRLTAGTYYVRIYPYLGTTTQPLNSSTTYQLSLSAIPALDTAGNTLNTARNLGALGISQTISEYVGTTDPTDYFRFTLNTSSNFNLSVDNLTADADVRLIRDINGNGLVDANEILASSTAGGSTSEFISTLLAAGTYFVNVYQFSGNTAYSLSLGASPVGDNTLGTANNLGALTASRSIDGFVGTSDTDDYYRFNLNTNQALSLALTGLSSDADLQLIRDFNSNGILDAGDILANSDRSGSSPEFIFRDLAAGTYFARVSQYAGDTNYTLTLTPQVDTAGNTLSSALNLGALSGSRTVNEVIGAIDTNDFYRFSLNTTSRLNLELNGLDAYANAQLIQDLNGNGLIESNEILAATTRNAGDLGSSLLSSTLNSGNYFIRVFPSDNTDTRYSLSLTATAVIPDNAGNTLATARNLGTLTNSVTLQDFVGQSDLNDYYRFGLSGNTNFSLLLNGLTADADVELIRDTNGNGLVDAGEVLRSSTLFGSSPESISLNLGAGTYFIRVYSFDGGNTTYTLNLSGNPAGNPFSSQYGYGLVNAAAAVARAVGRFSPFPDQPTFGGTNDWGANLVNAPEVWAQGYTGQGVIVAVVDTGVDYTHPDLAGRIWVNTGEIPNNGRDDDANGFIDDVRGWDFVSRDNTPFDEQGHGTHVSGTIAATNNDFGVTGIAYNAQIMPVRVLGADGSGTYANIALGVRYAADNGARVINLSLGGPNPAPEILAAIQYANQRGALVVISAGNSGESQPGYPARYANQVGIAVGAVDINTQLADFSNRAGNTPLSYVVAPGVNVYSTTPNNTYSYFNGTSMAAPHVAAVAALMLSANPTLTPAQLVSILAATANSSGVRV